MELLFERMLYLRGKCYRAAVLKSAVVNMKDSTCSWTKKKVNIVKFHTAGISHSLHCYGPDKNNLGEKDFFWHTVPEISLT